MQIWHASIDLFFYSTSISRNTYSLFSLSILTLNWQFLSRTSTLTAIASHQIKRISIKYLWHRKKIAMIKQIWSKSFELTMCWAGTITCWVSIWVCTTSTRATPKEHLSEWRWVEAVNCVGSVCGRIISSWLGFTFVDVVSTPTKQHKTTSVVVILSFSGTTMTRRFFLLFWAVRLYDCQKHA